MAKLEGILYPKSIAIVGASNKPGKIGYQLVKNIIDHGYKGKVYPVNPTAEKILGLKCYPALEAIPDDVDIAGVVVPAKLVPVVLQQAGKKKVKGLVIYASGFAEKGPEGEAYQRQVAALAKKNGVRILGPNTNGFFNGDIDLNMTFNPFKTLKGPVSIITQSGGLASGFTFEAIRQGISINKFINVENKADVNEIELMEFLAKDRSTKAIFMYLESIENVDEFVRVARKVTKIKPIVGYKAGLYPGGARIIAIHTGAKQKGEDIDRVFREAGIIHVKGVTEAIDTLNVLVHVPLPKGSKIGLLTNSTGISGIISDICEENGFKLPRFSEELGGRIGRILPPGLGFPYNPVDTTANTSYDIMKGVLTELINSEEVDIVVAAAIRSAFVPYEHFECAWRESFQLAKERDKPMVGVMMGDDAADQLVIETLKKAGMPVYPTPERAALSLVHLYEYSLIKKGKL